MKNEIHLNKPRSVRFTKEQEQAFSELEQKGLNISFLIRKVADMVISQQKQQNH